jgi:hypothetical protein
MVAVHFHDTVGVGKANNECLTKITRHDNWCITVIAKPAAGTTAEGPKLRAGLTYLLMDPTSSWSCTDDYEV